jgi:hypothetical protein
VSPGILEGPSGIVPRVYLHILITLNGYDGFVDIQYLASTGRESKWVVVFSIGAGSFERHVGPATTKIAACHEDLLRQIVHGH